MGRETRRIAKEGVNDGTRRPKAGEMTNLRRKGEWTGENTIQVRKKDSAGY